MPAAQEHYQKSLALNKEDGGVYLNFGLARFLSGSPDDTVEAFQVAISKFDSVAQAYEILGLGRLKETLGIRGAEKSVRKVSKNDLFDLLSQSLRNIPDRQKSNSQSQRVHEKYKNEQNRFVFGRRRGADPTQIASIKRISLLEGIRRTEILLLHLQMNITGSIGKCQLSLCLYQEQRMLFFQAMVDIHHMPIKMQFKVIEC